MSCAPQPGGAAAMPQGADPGVATEDRRTAQARALTYRDGDRCSAWVVLDGARRADR